MKAKPVFFSIPATDIKRSEEFYRNVFGWEIQLIECGSAEEQMGMINSEGVEGCIFTHKDYAPSKNGTQLSFEVDDIDLALKQVEQHGGRALMQKCMIGCEGKGYCALFADSEGNTVGLYSK